MTPKQVLNIVLILVTIVLMAFSVYLAIDGSEARATYCLVWALAVFLVARPIVS